MSANAAGLPPRFLRTPEAARFLGLSGRTLEKHRTYGTGPAYRKLGGRVVYRRGAYLHGSHARWDCDDAAGWHWVEGGSTVNAVGLCAQVSWYGWVRPATSSSQCDRHWAG